MGDRLNMSLIEELHIEDLHLTKNGYCAKMILGVFHAQPFGYLNGGAVLAFAEITAGQASNQMGEGKYHAVGQSVTGNHLNQKESTGILYAKAELLHAGYRSHVWNIKMIDENDRLISNVTVTNSLIYTK